MQAFEAAHSYAWEYDNHRDLLDENVRALIELGREATYPQYLGLLRQAHAARARFGELMQEFDAILTPSAPGEPPPSRRIAGDGFIMGDPVMSRGWTLLHVPVHHASSFHGTARHAGRDSIDRQLLRG